ncbi:MAG: DEAD/DEAH box helicase family protein [Deltaproteobacteria bacterium]|nr:DEAD/DEAH box helicase family protein [Deltaproteobacteria bacterium]
MKRYSSRPQQPLPRERFRELLQQARHYDRIAGYFRSSLLELVYEDLAQVEQVRVVCNSDLDPRDIAVARSARDKGAALKEKWTEGETVIDTVLARERYQRLYELLVRRNLDVRVVGRDKAPFLHGKAGVIESKSGSSTSFIGSGNETRQGWAEHYELMWEDDSPEAVAWVQAEFDYLWNLAVPLPDAVIDEIGRRAHRREHAAAEDCPPDKLAPAAVVESPMYGRGEILMPWQRSFVTLFAQHRARFGAARLLLADEVGLGKTLSLATAAMLSVLLGDGAVLVLCPATLTLQWQTELWDKLGVPSAVWTSRKSWLDHHGHEIRTNGAADVARCPFQVGIVSTGLIFRHTTERASLLERRFGTLILDEAHRARRGARLGKRGAANNLLDFAQRAAANSRHVLLGTATPIQTDVRELWDLLEILNRGANHVLGHPGSPWHSPDQVLPLLTGQAVVEDEDEAWNLVRNPLPPRGEDAFFDYVRSDLGVPDHAHFSSRPSLHLGGDTRDMLVERATERGRGPTFWQRTNPVVRHTVLRRRSALEEAGYLPRIAVDVHPLSEHEKPFFVGLGLLTNTKIDIAYHAAEDFTRELRKRTGSAGFLRSLMLQRICSSVASGLATAKKMLERGEMDDEGVDDEAAESAEIGLLTGAETAALQRVVDALEDEPTDPKLEAVLHYLLGEPDWLSYGCIVFSQYYDTAAWVAARLVEKVPGDEPIALYAGADRSRLFRGAIVSDVDRDAIKKAVKNREIRLVVATDAACEGLNLQTLGTLINVDLPWNPSRLEQRIGRIKRIGQTRTSVDMLNLVYAGTRDEAVYQRLSERLKNRYDLFGSLPDVIEDDWIDDIERLEEKLREFIERKREANAFDLRYRDTVDPKDEPWEKCAEVLSRRDLIERLSKPW